MKENISKRLLSLFLAMTMVVSLLVSNNYSTYAANKQVSEDTANEGAVSVDTDSDDYIATDSSATSDAVNASSGTKLDETATNDEDATNAVTVTTDETGSTVADDGITGEIEGEEVYEFSALADEPETETTIREGYNSGASYLETAKLVGYNYGDVIDVTKAFEVSLSFNYPRSTPNLQYYYQLPDNIKVANWGTVDSQIEKSIKTTVDGVEQDIVVCTYFVENNIIYYTFTKHYDATNFNISMEGSWQNVEGLTQINVKFPHNSYVFYTEGGKITVSKTGDNFSVLSDGRATTTFKLKITPSNKSYSVEDVYLVDYASTGAEAIIIPGKYTVEGESKDLKLVKYTQRGTVISSQYYTIDEVIKTDSSYTRYFKIDGLSFKDGEYYILEYDVELPNEVKFQYDKKKSIYAEVNYTTVYYPLPDSTAENPKYGNYSSYARVRYVGKNEWIYKEKGDDEKTKVIDGTVYNQVPYVITLNKDRFYNLGGSVIRDEISEFLDDGEDYKVVYDLTEDAEAKVSYIYGDAGTPGEAGEVIQKWIILPNDVYDTVYNYGRAMSGKTQLDVLRSNKTVLNNILAAIKEQAGEDSTEFTNEMAMKYVFTSEEKHSFVWFTPTYDVPYSYTITYCTLSHPEVNSFSNSAKIWYTDMEGAPAPGVGWTNPKKKVMTVSKENEGVYIKEDGNYYIDYTIKVGVPANSLPFDDVMLSDFVPSTMVYGVGDTYTAYDWFAGIDRSDISTVNADYDTSGGTKKNRENFAKVFNIYSESSRAAVQEVVNRAYPTVIGNNSITTEAAWGDGIGMTNYSSNYTTYSQKTAAADLDIKKIGQFDKGDNTFTINRYQIYLGDLPGTDSEGYEIVIKYTMQLNPYMVETLESILQRQNISELMLTNSVKAYTTYKDTDGLYYLNLKNGLISECSVDYYIAIDTTKPGLTKEVLAYDEEANRLKYSVMINPEDKIEATASTYYINDGLNTQGGSYIAGSFVLKDTAGNVIYSDNPATAVSSKYTGYAEKIDFEIDNTTHSYSMTLNNLNELFNGNTGENGKTMLKQMYLEYEIDTTDIPKEIEFRNTVLLSYENLKEGTDNKIHTTIGKAEVNYTLDPPIKKTVKNAASSLNGYVQTYEVVVNPSSTQSDGLEKDESFTVKDVHSDNMTYVFNSAKVIKVSNPGTTEATETDVTSSSKVMYNEINDNLAITVPISDPDAKYYITYDLKLNVMKTETMLLTNKAEIEGKDIAEVNVESRVRVVYRTASSTAETYAIKLKKYDRDDTNKPVQATYKLYSNYGSWTQKEVKPTEYGYESFTTDPETGELLLENKLSETGSPYLMLQKNILYGLVEVSAEKGYMIPKAAIQFMISDSTERVETVKNSDGSEYVYYHFKPVGVGEEPKTIYISNEKFKFDVRKIDSLTGELLPYAGFELRDKNGDVIGKYKDEDGDGIITIDNIPLDSEGNTDGYLYLYETEKPEGYEGSYQLGIKVNNYKIDSNGATQSYEVDGRFTFFYTNNRNWSDIKFGKKVVSANGQTTDKKFKFTVSNVKDNNGKAYTESIPGTYVDAFGEETSVEIYEGAEFYLGNNEYVVAKLPRSYSMTISEEKDENYFTQIERYVGTNSKTDEKTTNKTNYKTNSVTYSQVYSGEIYEAKFTNTENRSFYITKNCKTDSGLKLDIPDGLLINVVGTKYDLATKKYTDNYIIAKASYSKEKKQFEAVELADGVKFEAAGEGGFYLRNIPAKDSFHLIEEENEDIDGYVCTMKKTYKTINGLYNIKLTNTYSKSFIDLNLSAKKILENAKLKDKQFTFGLYDASSAYTINDLLMVSENDADGNVKFDVKYRVDPGDYYFVVKEIIKNSDGITYSSTTSTAVDGMTYSTDRYDIHLVVDQNEDGELYIKEQEITKYNSEKSQYETLGDDEKMTFTNTYKASGSTTLYFAKRTNISQYSGDYSFELTEYSDENCTVPKTVVNENTLEEEKVAYTVSNKSSTTYTETIEGKSNIYYLSKNSFTQLKYNVLDVGDHYYLLKEVIPEEKVEGMEYDDSVYKIIVHVIDGGKGKLTCLRDYYKYNKETNQYDLLIAETADTSYYDYYDNAIFVNNLIASYDCNLSFTKSVLFRGIGKDEFKFTIKRISRISKNFYYVKDEDNNVIQYKGSTEAAEFKYNCQDSSTTNAYANVVCDPITFVVNGERNDLGTYYYEISEDIPENAVLSGGKYTTPDGMVYTTDKYYVEVTVSYDKNNNKIVEKRTYYDNSRTYLGSDVSKVVFTNNYFPNSLTIKLEGHKSYVGDNHSPKNVYLQYDYTMTDDYGYVMSTSTDNRLCVSDENGLWSGSLTYNFYDIGRTYKYTFHEADAGKTSGGITNSDKKYYLTVIPTYDENGYFVLVDEDGNEPKLRDEAGNVVAFDKLDFENKYEAEGSFKIAIYKEFVNGTLSGDDFAFGLYENDKLISTVKNDKNGRIEFEIPLIKTWNNKEYDSENGVEEYYGEHIYDIKEIPGDDENIIYNDTVYTVAVNAEDNGSGRFKISYIADKSNVKCSVNNSLVMVLGDNGTWLKIPNYKKNGGSISFEGNKTLLNKDLSGDDFTFVMEEYLVDSEGNEVATDRSYEFTNDEDGVIDYPVISYNQYLEEGATLTYIYKIYEKQDDKKAGITYDDTVHTVKVSVANDPDAKDADDKPIGALKAVITELDGEDVTDLGEDETVSIDFTNKYEASSELVIVVGKQLLGNKLSDKQFTFGVYEGEELVATGSNDADGVVKFSPIKFVSTWNNKEYDRENGIDEYYGEHSYVIKEIAGEDEDIIYDDTVLEVTVTATDNGEGSFDFEEPTGKLTITALGDNVFVLEDAEAGFVNKYITTGSVIFTGTKTVDGKKPGDSKFDFVVVEYKLGADGKKEATGRSFTVSNDADGKIAYPEIAYAQFVEEGVSVKYIYEVSEVIKKDDTKMEYDKTVYEVTVSITDKDATDGKLDVEASSNAAKLDFANKTVTETTGTTTTETTTTTSTEVITTIVTEPTTQDKGETPKKPKTSDDAALPYAAMILFVSAVGVYVVSKKKKQK